ncbi:MAG TPA: GNAT family N-acetyltransferase [Spirochaetales bacterium]|nr:GNAT family N-acetyltransferase [Spirochaetales bacterium]HRY53647.1 GNAT family N-acetyltransferase [Spirochaetia bacterium]HRZ65011.1 GNAT family N-acetyltransferase [Spirochaetia bacterium]
MFSISSAHAASESLRGEVEDLVAACNRADGTASSVDFDTSLNFRQELPAWHAAREGQGEGGRLLGILSIFAPEADRAEITALVRPEARRRGLFSALLAAAEARLEGLGYRELLFLRDAASEPGGKLVELLRERRGASLDHREFSMVLKGGGAPEAKLPEGLLIERASGGDLGELASLNSQAFGDSEAEARSFLEATFAVPQRRVLVARGATAGPILGMVSVFVDGGEASINGLLAAKEERRRGIGSSLLDRAIALAAAEGAERICLEVDALNRGALGLYLRRGFEIESEDEYWKAPLQAGAHARVR